MWAFSRSVLPGLLVLGLVAPAGAETIVLGDFRFDSNLFGNTMTPQTPPLLVAGPWINVVNVTPAPGTYLTGPNFDTGIDLGAGPAFTIAYGTPIINQPGPDLGIITGPLRMPGEPVANLLIINNKTLLPYDPLRVGVDTGVTRTYFVQDQLDPAKSSGPFSPSLFVTPVDLSDFGIAEGEGIQSIGIGSTNGGVLGGPSLATFRVAGFEQGDAVAVPEPSMKWLLLLAVFVALVGSGGVSSKVALVVAAPLIALEANILRVAGIGLSIEVLGPALRDAAKEWLSWGRWR